MKENAQLVDKLYIELDLIGDTSLTMPEWIGELKSHLFQVLKLLNIHCFVTFRTNRYMELKPKDE